MAADPSRESFVYFVTTAPGGYVKIGNAQNLRRRLAELQTASPVLLQLKAAIRTRNAPSVERAFHRRYRSKRVFGEWFAITDELDRVMAAAPVYAEVSYGVPQFAVSFAAGTSQAELTRGLREAYGSAVVGLHLAAAAKPSLPHPTAQP